MSAGPAGVPGVPGVHGAAHVAVPARPPGVRALPRAPRRLPRVPHRLLVRAQPRHGGRGRAAALPVPPRLRPPRAAAAPRRARGQLRRAPLPLPRRALRLCLSAAARPRRARARRPPADAQTGTQTQVLSTSQYDALRQLVRDGRPRHVPLAHRRRHTHVGRGRVRGIHWT